MFDIVSQGGKRPTLVVRKRAGGVGYSIVGQFTNEDLARHAASLLTKHPLTGKISQDNFRVHAEVRTGQVHRAKSRAA